MRATITPGPLSATLLLPALLLGLFGCGDDSGDTEGGLTEQATASTSAESSSAGPSVTDGMTGMTGMTAGMTSTGSSSSSGTSSTGSATSDADTDATETSATDTSATSTTASSETDGTETDGTDTELEGPPLLDIKVEDQHACAVDADGLVYCWGSNTLSQLALPEDEQERLTPTWVEPVENVVEVAVGAGFTLALTGEGQVYCWGRGSMCAKGKQAPNVVEPELIEGLEGIETIEAGRINACGLRSDGELMCWGENGNGQVPDPSFVETPTLVDGLSAVAGMTVGDAHRCVFLEAGGVFCWGYGQAGRLGTGNEGDQAQPAAVSGLGAADDVELIAAGGTSSCASVAGEGLCWGGGKVGNGEFKPAIVSGLLDARRVAIGWSTACTLLGDQHALRCWGTNLHGTLGTGDEESSDALVTPVGLERADFVDVGGRTSCAIDGDALFCWGQNGEGVVGDGTKIDRLVPTQVFLP